MPQLLPTLLIFVLSLAGTSLSSRAIKKRYDLEHTNAVKSVSQLIISVGDTTSRDTPGTVSATDVYLAKYSQVLPMLGPVKNRFSSPSPQSPVARCPSRFEL